MKNAFAAFLFAFIAVATASAQIPLIRRGELLRWSVNGGQSGMMKITAVNGALFEVEQTNDVNRAAGVVRMYGAVVDNGRKIVLLNVGQWKEVWEGDLLRDKIVGTINAGSAHLGFQIFPAEHPEHHEEASIPFMPGRTLHWETNALGGQGGNLVVTRVEGPHFFLEQTNRKNPGAGVVRMEGELKDGRIYIYNRQYNETWVGIIDRGAVVGKVNGQVEFRVFE